jgi:glycerol-3-phosphate dehydrogenase (NAD(P)+)
MRRVGVIGAGAWGTALAQVCARAGLVVSLWAREREVAQAINVKHQNPLFLRGVDLHAAIRATHQAAELKGCDLVFAVTPAQHLRHGLRTFSPVLDPKVPIVLCAKGIESDTLALMSEVLADVMPATPAVILSGPSFAEEVARGLPTAVTLAATDEGLAQAVAQAIAGPVFRPYVSRDVIGAQAGGAIKNVLAIACGVVEGRGLGASARAALITRGFAELTRLALALGGEAETVAGLCGLGDLVLTCSSRQSRNMSLGVALGRGEALDRILRDRLSVAEGVTSAPAVTALARRLGVETPICDAVRAILAGEVAIDPAIQSLLSRPLRVEADRAPRGDFRDNALLRHAVPRQAGLAGPASGDA